MKTTTKHTSEVIDSGKADDKGRAIGYEVFTYSLIAVRWDNDVVSKGIYFAGVQNTRDGKAFGPQQRAKQFKDKAAAKRWAVSEARRRIAAI